MIGNDHQDAGRNHGHQRGNDDDRAPVEAVREGPQRPLRRRPSQNDGTHEQADARGRQSDVLSEDRSQGPEGAVGETHRETSRHADGRNPVELFQIRQDQGRRRGGGRLLHGERNRHGRQRHQDRRQGKKCERRGIGQPKHHLACRDHRQVDDRVDREDGAAKLVRRPFVQPALDDDVEHREAVAGRRALKRPQHCIHVQGVQDCHGRCQRRHRKVGADVAGPADKVGAVQTSGRETYEIERTEEADLERAEVFQIGSDGHERALEAVAHQQNGNADQQRGDGKQSCLEGLARRRSRP